MYKFKHKTERCNVNKLIFEAFDTRYTARRTLAYQIMSKYFSENYIRKFKNMVSRAPLTTYWPEFSEIIWKVDNNQLTSTIKVMKTMQGLSLGTEIKETWIVKNSKIDEVIRCETC